MSRLAKRGESDKLLSNHGNFLVESAMMDPNDSDSGIPRIFHSEYEDRPFKTCSRCGESLDAFDHYQINKAFRNEECIFEYVFCSNCRDNLLEEFSDESKERMMQHQQDHMHMSTSLDECAFCLKSMTQQNLKDYSVTALCRFDEVIDSLMICLECQDAMHELLSQKTKDVRRRFFEDLPGVPPDWEDLLEDTEPHQGVPALAKSYASSSASGFQQKEEDSKNLVSKKNFKNLEATNDGCLELIFNVRML